MPLQLGKKLLELYEWEELYCNYWNHVNGKNCTATTGTMWMGRTVLSAEQETLLEIVGEKTYIFLLLSERGIKIKSKTYRVRLNETPKEHPRKWKQNQAQDNYESMNMGRMRKGRMLRRSWRHWGGWGSAVTLLSLKHPGKGIMGQDFWTPLCA